CRTIVYENKVVNLRLAVKETLVKHDKDHCTPIHHQAKRCHIHPCPYRHALDLRTVLSINAYKAISMHPGKSLEGRNRFMFKFFLIRQITNHEPDAMTTNVQTVHKSSEKRISP